MANEIFEKMPVPKAYMKLSLPVVFSLMLTLVYNMVDTYFIALTGVEELVAGVSLVVPIFTMMIAFGDIFGIGGSALISRLFGERRYEDAKNVSAFCIWSSIAFSAFVTVVLMVFKDQILAILGADESTVKYASDYYTWISLGAVSIIFGLVPGNILRTEGLAAKAMTGSIIGSVLNIIFDPIFIFGLDMGAAGAGIATVLGNLIADVYYIYAIMNKSRNLSVSLSQVRIKAGLITSIFVIGIPASITNLMQSFMIMMTNHYLLVYGTDKVAAMGIALKANMITGLILVGFAFGGQPLIGYNYGCANHKRLKEILKFAYVFEAAVALVLTLAICLFAPEIIKLFMDQPEIVSNGTAMLRFQQAGMVFMAISLVSSCVCQSVGSGLGSLILSISRQGVMYMIAIAILSNLLGYHGILASQAFADVVTAIMSGFIITRILRKSRTL